MSDGTNKFLGKMDGTMFSGDSAQIANDLVNIIRDYYSGLSTVSESMLDTLRIINIRRDSAESYYLIPIIIYILKEYID